MMHCTPDFYFIPVAGFIGPFMVGILVERLNSFALPSVIMVCGYRIPLCQVSMNALEELLNRIAHQNPRMCMF